MTNRHLVCVVYSDSPSNPSIPSSDPMKWPIAQYGDDHGYPDRAGLHIVRFLADPANVKNLKAGLPHLYTPNADEKAIIDKDVTAANAADDAKTAAMGQAWNMFQEMMTASEGDNNPPSRQLYPSLCPSTSAAILDLVAQLGKNHLAGTPDKEIKLPAATHDTASGPASASAMTAFFAQLQQAMGPAQATGPRTAETTPPTVARAVRKGKLPIQREPDFANQSDYCRFAYVVDLDAETLEVFGDGRDNANFESKHEGHRFRDVGAPEDTVPNLVATITFAEVRAWVAEGKEVTEFRKRVGEERFTNVHRLVCVGAGRNGIWSRPPKISRFAMEEIVRRTRFEEWNP
ncbi:hypothetical protein F4860DRAFT_497360 [Xylaria cubensis]|nr:hypothetical protein F4860DRAFT_497360 [Xylaria cubensis]